MRPTARGRRWGHRSASSGDDRPIHRNGAGRGLASGGGLSAPTTPGASGRREPKGQLRTGKAVTAPSPCCELSRRKEAEQRPRPGAAFAPRPSANAAAGWSFRAAGRGLRRGEGGAAAPGPRLRAPSRCPPKASLPAAERGWLGTSRWPPCQGARRRGPLSALTRSAPAGPPGGGPDVLRPGPATRPFRLLCGNAASRLALAAPAGASGLLAAFPPPRFPRRTCCFFGEMF